ncbi:MAG: sulfur carrier protein ThiS [Elusimicrobia bacterium]|jgi:sulfur carrier protein|nr:sulfur carrier protein ThiS [Elusimicrobiota bacterium]MBK7208190.1 sulfur carrier protein ThiS [Elusimicrobiota bacterium]MBK7544954.1 sulfur carrier protein ThiS [Elusimicrobiota bacterium]MBK7574471.1 sulfur carrier protein ThiS [Elusimicrobiota bacterium]MBK7688165.1 sulfur carrier protein ThiS [Elusimicrobiota bacterium]
MKITLNGEAREVAEGTTVAGLVQVLGLATGRVAAEVNGDIVRRADHAAAVLRAGDVVEIVQMIGGG